MSTKTMNHTNDDHHNNAVGGFILIAIGLFFLLNQFVTFNIGNAFLPIVAGVFILAGIIKREAGLFIPGGIIAGIGFGAALVDSPAANLVSDDGGLFMLAFASGWVLITVLTAIFTHETHWWPLIPGSIIAFIGLGVTFGGLWLNILTILGQGWPLVLIAAGVYTLLKAKRPTEKTPEDIDWYE